ncbi:MAG: PD-(D/E)XK nuclease family protein [Ignavibacteriales bacterium]|nr:PD-(D/E)XK nuclease family protein [Ignavibacteriales bacterium]
MGSNSIYGGNICSNISSEAKSKLESFKGNIYSTSQLETYAKCPFKYFAERVLKLEPPQKPSEDFEALEMGSLLHKILYEFYTKLTKQKIILAGCSEKDFQKAKKLLFETARQNISEANFKSFFSFYDQEKILGINGIEQNSILYQFLLQERNSDTGFVPMFFETAFGELEKDNSKQNQQIKIKTGNTFLRGKIDRIDINEKDGVFSIVDYKLGGKKPKTDELTLGLSLQIPLYMLAASELIKSQLNKDMKPQHGYIYSLKFSEKEFGKKIVSLLKAADKKSDEELINSNNEMIKICIEAIDKYSLLISEGKFNLSTLVDRENKICGFCNFRSVCRIQEVDG